MVTLDFIYMGSADLLGTDRERKFQNEFYIMFPAGFEPTPQQESQRFWPLGHAGWVSNGVCIV